MEKFFDENNNLISEKKCLVCLNIKPLSDFNKSINGKFGVHNWCRLCVSEYNKNQYENSKDIKKRKSELWNLDNIDKTKEYKRKSYYKKMGKEVPEVKEINPLNDLPPIDNTLNF